MERNTTSQNGKEFEVITLETKEEIEGLESALTIEGLSEDSFIDFLNWTDSVAKIKDDGWKVYSISGGTMNREFGLTGNNAYPKDLTIACIDLDDLTSIGRLITERFNVGGRWLDDVIYNNVIRETNHC